MCGICGLVRVEVLRDSDTQAVEKMTAALFHRGPDEGGTWSHRNVALGARRLSIIDLAHGRQPMSNEDGSVTVVFNGEIYNAHELRDELTGKGYAFRTQCDTEVVLRAFEAWGDACVTRFNGMFALAVCDVRADRVFLARDRLGIKPLVYLHEGGVFAFSSELDSLLRSGLVRGELNPAAIDAYFTFLYVPCPDTIFTGVSKLGPGQTLVWEKGELRTEEYWRPEFAIDSSWTLDSAAEAYLDLLRDAVRLQRVSDVPLGAFLSGGIDSTSVVALLSEAGSPPVKTFTIGFEDADADETAYALQVAERFGTDHTVRVMHPDLIEMAPDLARFFGEPFADSSAVPTWMVSKLAREQVTVAMSGDGGDELFAGYSWLHMNERVATYRRVPRALRELANTTLRMAPGTPFVEKVRRFSSDSFLDAAESFRRRETCFAAGMRADLYGPDMGESIRRIAVDRFQEHLDSAAYLDGADRMLHQDLRMYLPDDILTKVDRMSMAVSLEARVPLLDHRIVEFAVTVPFHLKYNNGVSKRLVKHALRDRVPPDLLRQRKRGFAIPVHRWFRAELRDHFRDRVLVDDARLRVYLDAGVVNRIFEAHVAGREQYGHHLWALLMFEHWLRYMDENETMELSLPSAY